MGTFPKFSTLRSDAHVEDKFLEVLRFGIHDHQVPRIGFAPHGNTVTIKTVSGLRNFTSAEIQFGHATLVISLGLQPLSD